MVVRFKVGGYINSPAGAFAVGQIVEGNLRPGARASAGPSSPALTVDRIGHFDDPDENFRVILGFAEDPAPETVRDVFPPGTVVDFADASAN